MQQSLIRIKIVQLVPANLDSADLKFIGWADDSHAYALKRLVDHPLLPITEWVGYHLSRAIGLATPDFAVIWLDEQTPAFGSRMEPIQQIGLPPDRVQIAHYLGLSMKEVTAPIFAVDAFLPNDDRHLRNFMWRNTSTGLVPLAFDFSRAWLVSDQPFGAFPLAESTKTMQVWNYLRATFAYTAPLVAMDKIRNLPDNWLESVFNAAPPQWLADFYAAPTIEFWKTQRLTRCTAALALL